MRKRVDHAKHTVSAHWFNVTVGGLVVVGFAMIAAVVDYDTASQALATLPRH